MRKIIKLKRTKPQPKQRARARSSAGDQAMHVLLRVRSENGQTLTAHKEIVAKRGAALLGKMGQPIGPDFKDKLSEQIERGIKTFLFLTTREGWNGPYVTDRCLLRRVNDTLDAAKQSLVPSYYAYDQIPVRVYVPPPWNLTIV